MKWGREGHDRAERLQEGMDLVVMPHAESYPLFSPPYPLSLLRLGPEN